MPRPTNLQPHNIQQLCAGLRNLIVVLAAFWIEPSHYVSVFYSIACTWISRFICQGLKVWHILHSLWCKTFQRVPLLHRNLSVKSEQKDMAGQNGGSNIVVYVTVPNKDAGKTLANSIVSAKLAACVNQVPGIESTYWWQGKIETDSEVLLIIKTRESLLNALTEHVKANHEYEVPEVIALPIVGGNPQYLKWIEENTKAD